MLKAKTGGYTVNGQVNRKWAATGFVCRTEIRAERRCCDSLGCSVRLLSTEDQKKSAEHPLESRFAQSWQDCAEHSQNGWFCLRQREID